ncbi:hypothetical protein ElyMa_002883000 [Elysia marginata]|uniref:Uncharacterized protein n=1 Tax=Elysia marginata TaxID=1093978 RepID=A0AAV4I283_9GAST|nr:hypothetical protein ElyMa_002883000 [Elysia marginata]
MRIFKIQELPVAGYSFYKWVEWHGRESNPRPLDLESGALTTPPRSPKMAALMRTAEPSAISCTRLHLQTGKDVNRDVITTRPYGSNVNKILNKHPFDPRASML